jgi:hypothetical protein
MAGAAQGAHRRQVGRDVARLIIARLIEVEARGSKARVARLGELGAVEGEVRLHHRVEAEGIALLRHHADGLAPYFDNVGFGHGWISRRELKWCRSPTSTSITIAEVCPSLS